MAVMLAMAGCVYPAPELKRESMMGMPPEGMAVLHAYVEAADPVRLLPSNQQCTVIQVDDAAWSREMRREVVNRIVVEPGLHWVMVEVDFRLAKPSWTAFEFDLRPDREYALADTMIGCHALLGLGENRVIPRNVQLAEYADGQLVEVWDIDGICSNTAGGSPCREQGDCSGSQQCVLAGETGLGLCGIPSDDLGN